MKRELKEIVDKYKEFKDYLGGINIEIFEKFSREELKEFSKALYDNESKRYLQGELSDIIDKKKKEEYPELLGVHHYPKLKEIDFLSEEDKIKLDNLFISFGLNSFFGTMNFKWKNFIKNIGTKDGDIENKILAFLCKNNMIEVFYNIDNCCDMKLISKKQLENIIEYLSLIEKTENTTDELIKIDKLKDSFPYDLSFDYDGIQRCPDCEERIETSLEDYKDILNWELNKCYFRLIVDRDTSYDNL